VTKDKTDRRFDNLEFTPANQSGAAAAGVCRRRRQSSVLRPRVLFSLLQTVDHHTAGMGYPMCQRNERRVTPPPQSIPSM